MWRFAGTSAAAPQAAAIGALLQEKDPALTPAELISTLSSSAGGRDKRHRRRGRRRLPRRRRRARRGHRLPRHAALGYRDRR